MAFKKKRICPTLESDNHGSKSDNHGSKIIEFHFMKIYGDIFWFHPVIRPWFPKSCQQSDQLPRVYWDETTQSSRGQDVWPCLSFRSTQNCRENEQSWNYTLNAQSLINQVMLKSSHIRSLGPKRPILSLNLNIDQGALSHVRYLYPKWNCTLPL